MARALGMNPKKLPRLRPGPQQRWKLSIGAFIEECYRKRFGDADVTKDRRRLELPPERLLAASGIRALETSDSARQVADLACFFANLADDLQRWLTYGTADVELLQQVRGELQGILKALETGTPVPQVPMRPPPPAEPRARSPRHEWQAPVDEDIPF